MARLTLGFGTILSIACLVPAPASAEETSTGAREEARELSEQGQIHYNLGRFEEALREYERAYELYPHPAFLFNLGQCHRELGDYERALFFFEGYLREQPDAANRALVEELLGECRQALEGQQSDAEDESEAYEVSDGEANGQPPISAQTETASEAPADIGSGATSTEETVGETRTPVYRRWWFWTILGVVVAGVVVGGTIGGLNAAEPEVVPPAGSAGTVDWR